MARSALDYFPGAAQLRTCRSAALGAKSDRVPVTERNAAVVTGSICGWPDPRVLCLQPAPR
jgi:hypothetical protein